MEEQEFPLLRSAIEDARLLKTDRPDGLAVVTGVLFQTALAENEASSISFEPNLRQDIMAFVILEDQSRPLRFPECVFHRRACQGHARLLFAFDVDPLAPVPLLHRISARREGLIFHLEREGDLCNSGLGQLFQNQSAGHWKSKTDHQAKGGFLYHCGSRALKSIWAAMLTIPDFRPGRLYDSLLLLRA
jgi:hypothetical protein